MPIPSQQLPPRPLLRDSVRSRLQAAIVDGTLAPGEQLRDADLAVWLGVSRTPVREALLELIRAGLVLATPGRSTVVAPIDRASVRDAQAVVAAMHALAVRTAIPRLTADDLERMREANARFAASQAAGDTDAAMRADADFHAIVLAAAANAAAQSVIAQFEPVLHRAQRLRFASHEGVTSVERHERLIELCAAGDVAAATELAEQIWQTLTIDHATKGSPA